MPHLTFDQLVLSDYLNYGQSDEARLRPLGFSQGVSAVQTPTSPTQSLVQVPQQALSGLVNLSEGGDPGPGGLSGTLGDLDFNTPSLTDLAMGIASTAVPGLGLANFAAKNFVGANLADIAREMISPTPAPTSSQTSIDIEEPDHATFGQQFDFLDSTEKSLSIEEMIAAEEASRRANTTARAMDMINDTSMGGFGAEHGPAGQMAQDVTGKDAIGAAIAGGSLDAKDFPGYDAQGNRSTLGGPTSPGLGPGDPGFSGLGGSAGDVGAPDADPGPSAGVSPGDEETGESQSGPGGSGDKIICAELYKQGLLAEYIFRPDEAYGNLVPRDTLEGYHLWATPLVSLMQRSSKFSRFMALLAIPVATELAHRMGVGPGSRIGKFQLFWAEPTCKLMGKLINSYKESQWPSQPATL